MESKVKMNELAHIGVFVLDIEKTKEFYVKKLGFEVLHENQVERDGGRTIVAFLAKGNITFEFIQFPEFDGSRKDGIIDHVAIKVKDIETTAEELSKKGIRFETEEVQSLLHFWDKGTKWLMFRGPDNERIEISEIL